MRYHRRPLSGPVVLTLPPTAWRAGVPLVALPALLLAPAPLQSRGQEPVLRVLLAQAGSLELTAGPTPLRVGERGGRTLLHLPPGESLKLRKTGSGLQAVVDRRSGADEHHTLPLRDIWIEPAAAPSGGAQFMLKKRGFRGQLQVRPSGAALQAINHIGVESYLPSVVGSEMPASWPQEALRAQAVAARTYALRQRKPGAPFDLQATVASQVYKGVAAETDTTRRAVSSTRSQVLMHGNGLINAVFHSSSGGATENSGEIWTRQLPYLVSVPDYDEFSPVREWEKTITPWGLRRAFPEIGGATRIEVLSTTSAGRVRRARIHGPSGRTLVLKGSELRKRLELRSALARFYFEAQSGEPPVRLTMGLTQTAPRPKPIPVIPAKGSRAAPSGAPSSLAAALNGITRTSRSTVMSRLVESALPSRPVARRRRMAPGSLLVLGRGYGHGVGMSQWGAYGLARRGEGYEQILRHFYRGAEVRPYSPL